MREIASTLARLLAPILSFTAEEAWSFLAKDGSSVFLQEIPKPDERRVDPALNPLFDRLIQLRSLASAELEKARQTKTIGKSVDARLVLHLAGETELASFRGHETELAELFIVSQVELRKGDADRAEVAAPIGKKCARSWRWDESVGSDPEHPDLSARDAAAVHAWLKRGG
jgi:isoleucyl-tRNA synthetase